MTLTFLDLYNAAASQEWSMYDDDTSSNDEFEQPLMIALNKAATEILYSHPFGFRERTHVILTVPNQDSYDLPTGLICKNNSDQYTVKLNGKLLSLICDISELEKKKGAPKGFYIEGQKIVFYPAPDEKYIITTDYLTMAIGENAQGEEIFAYKNANDNVLVPEHLEELFKQAVISRAMINSIASESDENYSAYKKQSETAYRLLVKYAKGVELQKIVKI